MIGFCDRGRKWQLRLSKGVLNVFVWAKGRKHGRNLSQWMRKKAFGALGLALYLAIFLVLFQVKKEQREENEE